MSNATSIQWTDATWNPVVGCTWASAGCDHCYAATMTRRLEAMGKPDYTGLTTRKHFNGTVRTLEHKLDVPLHWRKPRRVFVNSMSDLFHKDVPFDFINRVFAMMALCRQHVFQVLTKRPDRMSEYLGLKSNNVNPGWHCKEAVTKAVYDWHAAQEIDDYRISNRLPTHPLQVAQDLREWNTWPLPNVWLGASVEDQAAADLRIPHLLRCRAHVRFLSVEPQIGPVDLTAIKRTDGSWMHPLKGRFNTIHWIIQGGESGKNARPFNIQWARDLRDQCNAAVVPYFLKQLGRVPVDDPSGYENGPLRCPKCADVVWSMDHRDFLGADDGNTFCNQCHHECEPLYTLKDSHGGDECEWPADLRNCRAMPETPK